MSCTKKDSKKGIFNAIVVENFAIGPRFYRLGIELQGDGAKAFAKASPGQFLEIQVEGLALPPENKIPTNLKDVSTRVSLIRKPFSFVDIKKCDDKTIVTILYCVLGSGTLRMTSIKKGDTVNIIGPLGNGFALPAGKKRAVLVAGGMGAPPLQHLAKELALSNPNLEIAVFVGARSALEMPFFSIQQAKSFDGESFVIDEFKGCGAHTHIATDDGTAGYKGFVTGILEQWLIKENPLKGETIIFTCGPEIMMEKVAGIAKQYGIDCHVSLERLMACGIGLCQSCAVEVLGKDDSRKNYKLCCKDGPVFDSKIVKW